MKKTYLVRVVSAMVLTSAALTAQIPREHDVAPLKNWPTPLYWQPTHAEKQGAATAVPNLQFPFPNLQVLSTDALIFVAITPCRLVDTRDPTNFPPGFGLPAGGSPLNPQGPITPSGRTFPIQNFTPVPGNVDCPSPLPSIAQAYSLNLTVVAPPNTTGFITAYPTGASPFLDATLDWSTTIVSNMAIVPAGKPAGSVTVFSGGANAGTDLVIDINGYFAAPTDLNSVTALGFQSFFSTNPSSFTTANPGYDVGVGDRAGYSNTTGASNTFLGSAAGYYNTTGSFNTAAGAGAGGTGTPGSNSMFGYNAGYNNNGASNSFFGRSTGFSSTTGSYNTFLGSGVGYNNGSGNYNTYIGYSTAVNATGSNNVYLANPGGSNPAESNTIRIGSQGTGAGQHNSVFVDPILRHPWASLDFLVSINNPSGQLGFFAFPKDSSKVLLGDGTFGSIPPGPGGVSSNCTAPGSFFLTKWSTSNSVQCSSITELGTGTFGNVGIGPNTLTPSRQLEVKGDINVLFTAPSSGHYQIGGNTVLSIDPFSSSSDNGNLFVGVGAGPSETGIHNTFVGWQAGGSSVTGDNNTISGWTAGQVNAGGANAFYGAAAGRGNTTGTNNGFFGYGAGQNNTTGTNNVFFGYQTGLANSTGSNNVCLGTHACADNTSGSANLSLGFFGGDLNVAGSNNIYLNNEGVASESNTIRIGANTASQAIAASTATYIAGIYDVALPSPSRQVCILSTGQLGWCGGSSLRFKDDVQDMGQSSSGLLRLRPVTFRYKKPAEDGSKPLDYGLIAEEVAEVYPDLVVRDAEGNVQGVQYQKLAPMLLNEVQKQHSVVSTQQGLIKAQQEQIQSQAQQILDLQQRFVRLETLMENR